MVFSELWIGMTIFSGKGNMKTKVATRCEEITL